MVEAQKFRIEQEMTNLVNELDKSYLRKMQGDMHRCAAKCCDDPQTSLERVHGCIENCTSSLNQANNYVQGEINHLQNRLQRCVMDCNDHARDRLGPDPSQETIDKCTIEFEKCAVKCVDKHIAIIPSMLKTMKAVLASGKPPPPKAN
ncbi:protein FAM136A [Spodoptera litura]|uniref:Protein FAM136A n=1 Tax=Spodoptera litura TaxID=69820 RepID=A0A9J7IN33_SPOLT|nr:protein FAM136A [Spodoptera litura]